MQQPTASRNDWISVAVLAIGTFLVYYPSLWCGFFSDDFQWLGRMNATLERPSFVLTVIYRDFNPVLHLSFVIDWLAGRGSAVVFHADSILIHLLNTILLFLLCRRLGMTARAGFALTLLWAWNVRISEAVIWPAARGHALATTFVLAAFVVLLSPLRRRQPLAVLLFVLALLTKETALMPLLLVPLFVGPARRNWRLFGALATLAGAFVLFNIVAKPDFHTSGAPIGSLLLKIPFILLRPIGLGDYYDFSPAMGVAVLLLFAAVAWLTRRTPALIGFGWIVACTLPIIPLDKLSSRYLYMMAIGYCWVAYGAACWAAPRISSARRVRFARAATASVVALLAAVGAMQIRAEIRDYRDLGRPYATCLAILKEQLRGLAPGETLVMLDVGPREAIPRLAREINGRGTITKLIPSRETGIDGLIALPDAINIATDRSEGLLAYPAPLDGDGPVRYVVYDGSVARRVKPIPADRLPAGRFFVARWGRSADYFEGSGGR